MLKIPAIILFVFIALTGRAQQNKLSLAEINSSPADTNKVIRLIRLGNICMDNPSENPETRDSAYLCYKLALALSNKLHNTYWQTRSGEQIAYYFNDLGDFTSAIRIEKGLLETYYKKKNFREEAMAWQAIGNYTGDLDSSRSCYQKAYELFKKAGDRIGEIGALNKIGANMLQANKLDSANFVLNDVIRQYQAIGYKKLQYTYNDFADVVAKQGHLNDELFYRLAAVKSMEAYGDLQTAPQYYYLLAYIYATLNNYPKSLYYARKTYNCGDTPYAYAGINFTVGALLQLKKPDVALAFLQKAIKLHPPVRDGEENIELAGFADIYSNLKQNKKAESYYLQALKQFLKWQGAHIRDTTDFARHYLRSIQFFVETGQFRKAGYYLKSLPHDFDKNIHPHTLILLTLMRSKVDSAFGNYIFAIKDLQLYKSRSDSLSRTEAVKAAQEIQNKYDMEKRDQSIKVLQSEQKVQSLAIQKTIAQRNITLAAIVVALILAGIAYNGYRRKKLSGLLISQKNNQLQILLTEKDRSNLLINQKNDQLQVLLSEKDWLLKEVHHRVKNNLHTVFCLLESQAKYLTDDALKAVEVSQHRIYAMSLIHQKLYQSDDIKTVDIGVYLSEFISYLTESFDTDEYIRFELNIAPIILDIAQAIPVALIINEAVTNAIKHAFPNDRKGNIAVSLQEQEQEIILEVFDDGIGIGFFNETEEPNSLGLVLMQGLAEDLHGTFTIGNKQGTRMEVVFPTADILVS